MRKTIYSLSSILLALLLLSCADSKVQSIEALQQALVKANPGDTIVLANGTYTDVDIQILARGTQEKPIVIRAEELGKVFIEGKSNLQLSGEYVEIHGLYFRNGFSDKPVIKYSLKNDVANNCRITQCVIENYNPDDRSTKNTWVALYGRNNRFDHNTLIGKQNAESTVIIQLNEERSQENNHSIDHNYFGRRPNYGSNGAETIRVGNSTYSLTSSQTQIIDNWFEHCDGEVEHVSIKACDNYIARNVFYECAGELVLRHGNRNTVENNVFIGNWKPHTGGIRIVNSDQIIRNNYLENLTGKRFYAALAVMNGVPNPLPNRYHQVENTVIENNQFVRCDHIEFGVGADFERTIPPVNTTLKNNLFYYPEKAVVMEVHTDISGISFVDNKYASSKEHKMPGFRSVGSREVPACVLPVQKAACGASWYVEKNEEKQNRNAKSIVVDEAQNSLVDAVKKAEQGDTIVLKNGVQYLIDQSVIVDKSICIKSMDINNSLPKIRYNGKKGQTAMITIADGGVLYVNGIEFHGEPYQGNSRPMAGIAPAAKMSGTYSAVVENCIFNYFQESSFAGFKALKNSFADSLTFINCKFHDISGEGIGLGAEKNDDGRYSAENIVIKNCDFNNILGCAVNIYRGGTDESTHGPSLSISDCTFELSSNQERGSTLRLIGVQTAYLSNLTFKNSGRGGAAIKFDECRWDDIRLDNIKYENSGKLRMNSLYR